MRVAGSRSSTSRTRAAGAAQIRSPIRKTTAGSASASLMSIEEKKIREGVRASNEVRPGRGEERRPEVGGPFGPEVQGRVGNGVAKRKPGSVQRLAGRRPFQRLRLKPRGARYPSAAAAGVHRIADDRVADVLEMGPDLVRAPRVQLEPHEVDAPEARDDVRVRAGRTSLWSDRHALAVAGMAGEGGRDDGGALVEMSPGESRVRPFHSARGEHVAEPSVCEIGL